jgi:hypothetical protein
MGHGERIYSVRYAGEAAYVVTFRQTDPFYTIDLSNPAAPHVAGELKLPGFSSYLHPIDDGLVIGVGQSASDAGRVQGTKVSLFDVSDLAAPAELATWTLPSASSMAEADHHAFLWWPATQQLVLPLQQWGAPTGDGRDAFSGAVVLHVDRNAISEVGRVEHGSVDVPDACRPMPMPVEPGAATSPNAGVSAPCPPISQVDPIQRSLVLGDQLWTLGQWTLQANALADLGRSAVVAVD